MTLFLWAMLAATCAALMRALAAFDWLIGIGSAAAGDPTGGRKCKRGAIDAAKESSFRKGLGRNRLLVKWLFQAPGWASESRNARSLCRGFQIGSAIALTGFVSSGAGVFLQI